ncbi:M61 family metallopeptidase [Hymenobacter psychrophilus]|uniref:Predicted metalloprotease, contains C-terminal PDZ domain n=1 Tax=Hymenobacter psychrophilus TaxID=651662 RepID=A0A1H3CRN4_9BACT|nr:PDZ domain-containing protein [Hymenobacter psychrophilus]SDX56700.1 Predicted metalloprotease, contains C-terminal PDZ domain [Hymenobacter psychrophilus]
MLLTAPHRRLAVAALGVLLGHAAPAALAAPTLRYTLAMPAPQTHYFEVEMNLDGFNKAYTDVKMPVWAPGSYLIREFERNVEDFGATAGSQPLRTEKVDKNTWRVYHPKARTFAVRYKVYAYELSVRTSFIDASHGYVNGTSVFMYPAENKQLPSQLEVKPAAGWSQVSTSLKPAGGTFTYRSSNYDELADSPIEIGNQKIYTFNANGTPHTVAMYGDPIVDEQRLTRDMQRVCEEAHKVVDRNPLDRYLFIVHNIDRGTGGLEHLFSTTLSVSRNAYASEAGWKGFLGLVSHEYFHLWNVKRIRPVALGPFDYDKENYTRMLWLSEGGTEYFSNLIMQRAGFLSPDQYLGDLSNGINRVENTPGNKVQSAADASFDAWIKQYRPNENSGNTAISYYDKGEVILATLDLMVINATKGQKRLDDVMQYLYDQYYLKQGRGFTDQEYQDAVAKVAGQRFDEFFTKHVYGTEMLPYEQALAYAGLRLSVVPTPATDIDLGARISPANGRQTVAGVVRDGSAWQGGLNVGDEILSLDGVRVTDDLNKLLAGRPVGSSVKVLVTREGRVQELNFPLLASPVSRYRIERQPNPTAEQQRVFDKWLPVRS